MALRPFISLVTLLLVIAACAGESGPAAPPVQGAVSVCSGTFCLQHPEGWEAEIGDTFVNLSRPDVEGVVGSAGQVNMEALVTAAGGAWPTNEEEVVRAFWTLLGDPAGLDTIADRGGGVVWSQGRLDDGILWHALIPVAGPSAIAVEVRAPNSSWEPHADAIRLDVTLGP